MSKLPEKLVELSIMGPASRFGLPEVLRNFLLQQGLVQEDIVDYSQDGNAGVQTFLRSLAQAERLKEKIIQLKLKNVRVNLTLLKKADWRDRWKRDFAPFHLTRRLDIVPAWHRKKYKALRNRTPILIDTVTAFGTGLHDTTRFMAELIEQCRGQFNSVLDIGTGTGILALVALKSEAKEVWAVDIDPQAIEVARANCRRNKCELNYLGALDIKTLKSNKKFDLVVANLTTHDLVRLKRKIISLVAPGKLLAVSGVSVENAPWLQKEFARLPLQCLTIKKSRAWQAFLFKRKRTQ